MAFPSTEMSPLLSVKNRKRLRSDVYTCRAQLAPGPRKREKHGPLADSSAQQGHTFRKDVYTAAGGPPAHLMRRTLARSAGLSSTGGSTRPGVRRQRQGGADERRYSTKGSSGVLAGASSTGAPNAAEDGGATHIRGAMRCGDLHCETNPFRQKVLRQRMFGQTCKTRRGQNGGCVRTCGNTTNRVDGNGRRIRREWTGDERR